MYAKVNRLTVMTLQDRKDLETASNYMEESNKFMDEAVSAVYNLDDWPDQRRREQVKDWLLAAENFALEAADLIRKVNRLQ